MSAVATREASMADPRAPMVKTSAERLFEPKGPTLEDRIVTAWDELTAEGRVGCPVCGGEMSRTRGCESCGSELA